MLDEPIQLRPATSSPTLLKCIYNAFANASAIYLSGQYLRRKNKFQNFSTLSTEICVKCSLVRVVG